MKQIKVLHNRDGWDKYNKECFIIETPFLISFIENMYNAHKMLPNIGETLCVEIGDDDLSVYDVRQIWHYNNHITFVLEEDKDIKNFY